MNKQILRAAAKQKRNQLTKEQRAQFSKNICEFILASPDFIEAKTVMCYCAYGSEADISPVLEQALLMDKHLLLPKVYLLEGSIKALEIKDIAHLHINEHLCTGAYGILEPNEQSCEVVETQKIDLVLVPLIAFDKHCHRLGSGMGYYDKFLPLLRSDCKKCGIAFAQQEIEKVPAKAYDIALDYIVTQDGVYINRTR